MSKTIDFNNSFSPDEFSSLSISCTAANLSIAPSKDDMAHIECKNVPEGSYAEVSGGTLRVKVKEPDILDKIFNSLFSETSCRIFLPGKLSDSFGSEEKVYDDVSVDIGVGNGKITGVSCVSASVRTGAGNCSISEMNVQKQVKLECGVGNASLRSFSAGALEIRTGTGNVDVDGDVCGLDIRGGVGNICFDGRVDGDIDVKGSVGNITLRLHDRHEGEYKLRTEQGMGRLNVEYV